MASTFLPPVISLTCITLAVLLHRTDIGRRPLLALILINPAVAAAVTALLLAFHTDSAVDRLTLVAALVIVVASIVEKTGLFLETNLFKEA